MAACFQRYSWRRTLRCSAVVECRYCLIDRKNDPGVKRVRCCWVLYQVRSLLCQWERCVLHRAHVTSVTPRKEHPRTRILNVGERESVLLSGLDETLPGVGQELVHRLGQVGRN